MQQKDLKEHIYYILRYWQKAVDFEHGGIHFQRQNFSKDPIKQGKKCLLMHARQLYDFSVGFEYGFNDAQKIALHLYNSIDKVFPRYRGLHYSFNFSDMPSEKNLLSSYDLFYVVIGLSRYAKTFNDKEAFSKAKVIFLSTISFFIDDSLSERGIFTNFNTKEKNFFGKTGNSILHLLEASINLMIAAQRIFGDDLWKNEVQDITKFISPLYRLYEQRIYDKKLQVTDELFNDDFSPSDEQKYGYATGSHALEWFGFWLEISWLLGQKTEFLRESARALVDMTLKRCFYPNGCFQNNYFLRERKTFPVASFWAQPEAILGSFYAATFFGKRQYAVLGEKMFNFYVKNFPDRKFGGIFSDVTYNNVIINRNKGFSMKCDHHPIRMCEKIIGYNLLGK